MSYAIIRNTNYKIKNLAGIYRHNERKNTNYSNKDINKNSTIKNYSLKKPKTTYEKLFKIIKEEYNLKGQIKSVSNVACEYIITSDKEFFEDIGQEETKRFFKTAYSFVCNYKNLGEQYILSAKVHMDEKTPHMHIVFIPVIHTKDKKGNNIDKIACSMFWKGKNSYKILQDTFYDYMISNGFNLERGKESDKKHISTEHLKNLTHYDQIKKEIENTPIKPIETNSLDVALKENKKLVNHCNRLREYCITSALTYEKCDNYKNEINNLKKENSKLKNKIKFLKEKMISTLKRISIVFKIPEKILIDFLDKNR